MSKVTWKTEPDEHDYPAAATYLSLIATAGQVTGVVERLRQAPLSHYKAKDILRASELPLLSPDNAHVAAELTKIRHGKALSPILLIRGNAPHGIALQVADGHHRICASYHVDESTDIPCRIAGWE